MSRYFSNLARKRAIQAEARRPRPIPNQGRETFRARCPGCHADNVLMSELDPNTKKATPPAKGDAIRCEICGVFHIVAQVDGYRVKTFRLDVGDA